MVRQEAASRIQYAEAFEVAEFGRQVREDEVFALLPMLQRSYLISGTKDWTDTGVEIKEGDVFEVSAEGSVIWKREGREKCEPDGAVPYTRWGNKPVLGAPTGALIARIGTDPKESFLIGSGRKIIAHRSGKLYLGINDDNTGDNDGAYRAWIKND
jgi:hypothetical protein